MDTPRGSRNALLILVAAASLAAGLVAGSGVGQERAAIREVEGVVTSVASDGATVCLDTPPEDGSSECRPPRLPPGSTLPAPGARVKAGGSQLPGATGICCSPYWLYFEPVS